MGASGFVGSHVTRKLAERGDDVRVYLRKSSKTMGIDDLDVERCYGDLYDEDALRAAMADRDVVYYCVVDTRFHLRDPAPLFETNVNCLHGCSISPPTPICIGSCSAAPSARSPSAKAVAGDRGRCVQLAGKSAGLTSSRAVKAEELVLRYARERATARRRDECVQPVRTAGLAAEPRVDGEIWRPWARSRCGSTACPPKSWASRMWQTRSCLPAKRPGRRALHHLRDLHADAGDADDRGGRGRGASHRASAFRSR